MPNNAVWILSNIYAPCTPLGKRDFIQWFHDVRMPDTVDWRLVGDFNLYCSPEDRNKPGADIVEMLMFNEAIAVLVLVELPLRGKWFTWTNKHQSRLLERLDWFFSSPCWTLSYPSSEVTTLTMETSDHVPCVVQISTSIPKGNIFLFENCWMMHDTFLEQVQQGWFSPVFHSDAAKRLTAKFKNLRKVLKDWSRSLSNLQQTIDNVKLVLNFLNFLEDYRDLSH